MVFRKSFKRALALGFTVFILYMIYGKTDLHSLKNNFININKTNLFWAFCLFPVLPLIKAFRWKIILGKELNPTYFAALKVLMTGSVFNLFAPSKLGDFSRVYFSRKILTVDPKRIFNSVIVEKISDVFTLCLVCLISLNFVDVNYRIKIFILIFSFMLFFCLFAVVNINFHKFKFSEYLFQKLRLMEIFDDARGLKKELKYNKIYFIKILFISIFYWYIVLFQIYLFFLTFNTHVSLLLVFGLVPVALFIGMIPVTISGIGTRDVALIFLFSRYYSPEIMASIGILCSSRSLVNSLIGLPFFLMHCFSENKIQEQRVEN